MADAPEGFQKIGQGTRRLFGPEGLIACGFSAEEQEKLAALLERLELPDLPVWFCGEPEARMTLAGIYGLEPGHGRGVSSSLTRAIVVSGIAERKLHELMKGYRTLGLPRTLWAALTPVSQHWMLAELLFALKKEDEEFGKMKGTNRKLNGDVLDTVLLLALPASGKSEVRRYLAHLPADECRREFHLGPTVQLDDFPYVHMMRRIDEELKKLGAEYVFFQSPEKPFRDTRDWLTLIELVNEDYFDLVANRRPEPASAAAWALERIERAAGKAGIPARLGALDGAIRGNLEAALEQDGRRLLEEKLAGYPEGLEGRTLVIEFARGGPQGSSMPLPEHYGYAHSLARLAPEILERASILYIWVTPEESRRKNEQRADPNDPGSILHHGVPIEVMLNDYGCDDMDWLEQNTERPGTVTVKTGGKTFFLPVARFDNREDKTTFIREDPEKWPEEKVRALRAELKRALDQLFERAKG